MQKRLLGYKGFMLSIIITVMIISCAYRNTDPEITDKRNLLKAIEDSAGYLQMNVSKDGTFNYVINMNPEVKVKQRYNILRHAGAIYSMTQYYELYKDEEILNSMFRAGNYLKSMIEPLPGKENILAVWSRPDVNKVSKLHQAKLGGAGLGLIALVGIENISPGFTSLDDLRKIGEFILYMQKQDGSFYSKYIPDKGELRDDWHSLYYPGEAALGLLMLYEIDPSEKWSASAIKALEYLALKSKKKGAVVDHWTLLATEKLLKSTGILSIDYNRQLLLDHATEISRLIIDEQINGAIQDVLNGGFTYDGRTTPASTRLEGLLAALNIITDDKILREKIKNSVESGMMFLMNSRVRNGQYKGAFTRSVLNIPLNTPAISKLNKRATEVRIDYVQHALSAMIQYYNFFIVGN